MPRSTTHIDLLHLHFGEGVLADGGKILELLVLVKLLDLAVLHVKAQLQRLLVILILVLGRGAGLAGRPAGLGLAAPLLGGLALVLDEADEVLQGQLSSRLVQDVLGPVRVQRRGGDLHAIDRLLGDHHWVHGTSHLQRTPALLLHELGDGAVHVLAGLHALGDCELRLVALQDILLGDVRVAGAHDADRHRFEVELRDGELQLCP
mmetsp:Transcript_49599/g.146563  ORF Transcript_49599/g.146563 Transcript_49599/m.146563 type:complete len:206 (+) Transcript_49599:780-1397(+)